MGNPRPLGRGVEVSFVEVLLDALLVCVSTVHEIVWSVVKWARNPPGWSPGIR
jgi:hypothetical protein